MMFKHNIQKITNIDEILKTCNQKLTTFLVY